MLTTDFSPFGFSTCRLPEAQRLPMWREQFGRAFLRADIEPLSDLPPVAEVELRALPDVRFIKAVWSAVRFRRNRALVADGDDSISVIVSKGCTASQRDRDVALNAGDCVAVLSQEAAEVAFAEGPLLSVFVPRAALEERASNVDDLTLRLIPRRSQALSLLVDYLKLIQNKGVLASPELRNAAASHVHTLVALALTKHASLGESNLTAIAAARLSAALDCIAAHFSDPELSLIKVAGSLHISPRYLQRLLEGADTSFTAHVNELRLKQAFTLLTEQSKREARISDIALRVGFSDISHFNRLFRARFGDTPSGVRTHASRGYPGRPSA
jgi:AraC-like DNA-binding protein